MFKTLFKQALIEALNGGLPKNLLATRKLQGSTGAGRLKQGLLAKRWRRNIKCPPALQRLKDEESGVRLLNDQEVQMIKDLFHISDLEKAGSRNLGNTGITMYIANNKYYIKK